MEGQANEKPSDLGLYGLAAHAVPHPTFGVDRTPDPDRLPGLAFSEEAAKRVRDLEARIRARLADIAQPRFWLDGSRGLTGCSGASGSRTTDTPSGPPERPQQPAGGPGEALSCPRCEREPAPEHVEPDPSAIAVRVRRWWCEHVWSEPVS